MFLVWLSCPCFVYYFLDVHIQFAVAVALWTVPNFHLALLKFRQSSSCFFWTCLPGQLFIVEIIRLKTALVKFIALVLQVLMLFIKFLTFFSKTFSVNSRLCFRYVTYFPSFFISSWAFFISSIVIFRLAVIKILYQHLSFLYLYLWFRLEKSRFQHLQKIIFS